MYGSGYESTQFAGERLTVSVLILYEDLPTGKRAMEVYHSLVRSLQEAGAFEYQLWKFSVLGDEQLRLLAASEAATADIVFVSARGDEDLPEHVKSWLELWVDKTHQPAALVALFETPDEAENICHYLRELADRGRLDFFAPVGRPQRLQLGAYNFSPRFQW